MKDYTYSNYQCPQIILGIIVIFSLSLINVNGADVFYSSGIELTNVFPFKSKNNYYSVLAGHNNVIQKKQYSQFKSPAIENYLLDIPIALGNSIDSPFTDLQALIIRERVYSGYMNPMSTIGASSSSSSLSVIVNNGSSNGSGISSTVIIANGGGTRTSTMTMNGGSTTINGSSVEGNQNIILNNNASGRLNGNIPNSNIAPSSNPTTTTSSHTPSTTTPTTLSPPKQSSSSMLQLTMTILLIVLIL